MPPDIDVVIAFRAVGGASNSKQRLREDARKAEQQYSRLIDTLTYAGLKAVGRRGESLGHLVVLVSCPEKNVFNLAKREKESDFLSGLPASPVNSQDRTPISPADRIRLVYSYVTSVPSDGGLGVAPGASEWDLVESVMALHDHEFNHAWVKSWKLKDITSVKLDLIREQLGESVALYFAFLSSYTTALVFPAFLGLFTYLFGTPYSPIYSTLLVIWATFFVEWWRMRERILSLRWGTRGSFRVEKHRVEYTAEPPQAWWHRDVKVLFSIPVIALFAGVLVALLTGIFVFEAFVTQLYTGSGQKYVSFSPTILFVVLVPRLLAIYQAIAIRLTKWENHAHRSTYNASLTLKTFALSALVAYLGLGLSAFVYVPFGEGVMQIVQAFLFKGTVKVAAAVENVDAKFDANATTSPNVTSSWDFNKLDARRKLNPGRLRDQMFAYTVTNQVVNTFVEVGLPFILRGISSFKARKLGKDNNKHQDNVAQDNNTSASASSTGTPRRALRRVVFEDEKEKGGLEERAFLDRVREEVALPEFELFGDYSEMVTQFGYVAVWSTIWPLAPLMALINNILELRSDAFKMTVHTRRPIPSRTDTIGPWLDALTFLTWLGALTNSALVYLFCPRSQDHCQATSGLSPLERVHQQMFLAAAGNGSAGGAGSDSLGDTGADARRELLMTALVIALGASHGYFLLRTVIRHVVERAVWKTSVEVQEREKTEKTLKKRFFAQSAQNDGSGMDRQRRASDVVEGGAGGEGGGDGEVVSFWDHDEGLEEIQRITKEV